ncbi:MAG: Regulatory protein [uncultured bacterium]|nr:MAG: Regulatory protein [uncultured bacterium]
MNIKLLILDKIRVQKQIKATQIVKETGFSRVYVNRIFRELRDEGRIILIGKANRAVYVLAEKKALEEAKGHILSFREVFVNKNLSEEDVLKRAKDESGVLLGLKNNVSEILNYTFLEMVNNAIEHSGSETVVVELGKGEGIITFMIADSGVGIFNNIKNKFNLPDILSAIQFLLKGKQTTMPDSHTGQGIFFSSKMADSFMIISSGKKIRFFNTNDLDDVFIENIKDEPGTQIHFIISLNSNRSEQEIFEKFTNQDTFEFSKTHILIKLYEISKNPLSRSEARRVMIGLNSFKEIVLDFKDVESVGQGFADEIFRVWQNSHPDIKISYVNAVENVEFMIKRV